jgi:hypothetical protein
MPRINTGLTEPMASAQYSPGKNWMTGMEGKATKK